MQIKQIDNKLNRSASTIELREKWLKEIRRARRVYSFQKWADQRNEREISAGEISQWIYDDVEYIVVNCMNLFLQLRRYGAAIKKEYGLSYLQQWHRMVYLVFVIRTKAVRFRLNHFFDQTRWHHVKDFALGTHIKVHNQILGYPHHDDLGILVHKLKFFEFCKARGLQTPEILAVFEAGKITYLSNGKFSFPQADLFVKELASGMGMGAKKFSYKNEFYQDTDNRLFTEHDIHQFLINYSKNTNSILVQNALRNHDSWKKFTSGSLATCRIVTGISPFNEDKVIPFFAAMKMPTGKSDIDNFSKGNIATSVDIQTGIMQSAISCKPINGKFVFDVHPDSGHLIKGEVLPFWNELVEFAKKVHLQFKTICVGWDISLTEEGFTVLEGNVEWGSDVIEGPANYLIADTAYPEWFDGWVKRMNGKELIP